MLPLAAGVCVAAAVTGRLTPVLGMRTMVVTGMAVGTVAVLLLTRIDAGSTYGDFLAPFILLGFAVGLSVAPCTDTIMGSFPENELGVGGGVNDTALELGGSLGIAILGSLLATSYRDNLTDAVGTALPQAPLDAARDSIGGALAVAERLAHDPQATPAQAQALVSAAHSAFSDAVAATSLVGGIIMAAGTMIVLALLPGRSHPARRDAAVPADPAKTPVA